MDKDASGILPFKVYENHREPAKRTYGNQRKMASDTETLGEVVVNGIKRQSRH